jgi:selenium-binding protein 1
MMDRRTFLGSAAALIAATALRRVDAMAGMHETAALACGPIYPSPQAAMVSQREILAYVSALYVGTGRQEPDYMAVVDLDPQSATYGTVVNRVPMPNVGDELHHFGWNMCSSCYGHAGACRRYMVVPGLTSGNIHVLDASEPNAPKLHRVIEGAEVAERTGLSAPHTVHCAPDGSIIISMLGDSAGRGPGGFIALDQGFNLVGRWDRGNAGMRYNYDFWYQVRHNVMVSSEWAAPNTFRPGFRMEDVQAGKYGHRLHFWDWNRRELVQTVDLGAEGMVPLEVRFLHNPDALLGFVGATLSSAVWNFYRDDGLWKVRKVIQVEPVELEGWAFPVPGLITDILLSMDDRFLYMSNWLHGDIRQYDISDPASPRLAGQVWIGGLLGKPMSLLGKRVYGGPQMLQLSLDGRRLYVTNSLFSSWDNQFYPGLAENGSSLLLIDCDAVNGGMALNQQFHVSFGDEPNGPARAHEMRFPGGDCTSDIWT